MRQPRRGLTVGLTVGALAAVMALPVAWYLLSPLFITRAVDEPLPGAATMATTDVRPQATATFDIASTADAAMAATLDAGRSATEAVMAMEATAGMETAMAMPTMLAEEPMPTEAAAAPQVLRQGDFYHVVHEGEGRATIYALPDGSRVLRLEDFSVLNGPDLHVYLAPLDPVPSQVGVDLPGAVDLGPLKGNVGNQNYALSPDLDLSQFGSVVIWCVPFRVPFIAAALS